MSKLGTLAFKGTGGHKFDFSVFPIDTKLKAGHGGVYVVTRRHDEGHAHHGNHVVFIGETDDLSTVMENHPEQALFEQEQANCICVHATADAAARERICTDLREHYNSDG